MNNEIKEILTNCEKAINEASGYNDTTDKILDYITNLQQENERLKVKYDNNKSHKINYKYFTTLYSKATKDIVIDDLVYKCEDLDNLKKSYEKLYIEKENYKSRCEKATEITENLLKTEKSGYYQIIFKQQLNILQNGSEKDDR